MEAMIAPLTVDDDPHACGIRDCSHEATFRVVKLKNDGTEEEKFFCSVHGQQYAQRGHLAISENT
jgi:hypothetical protein